MAGPQVLDADLGETFIGQADRYTHSGPDHMQRAFDGSGLRQDGAGDAGKRHREPQAGAGGALAFPGSKRSLEADRTGA